MRKSLVLLFAAAALAGAGCGGGGDDGDEAAQKEIRQVLADFEKLSQESNGLEICQRLFTEGLVRSVKEASDKGNCAAEVNENNGTPEAVIDVQSISLADERNAVADITVQNGVENSVYLVKTDQDEWRIRSIQPKS